MTDVTVEQIQILNSRLAILDNAYVAGKEITTLSNLGFDVLNMSPTQVQQEYKKVVLEINALITELDLLQESITYA